MRGLARIASAESHRVRRWDVVVLGGALPGLIAAVRLGQRGARVLIVEEAAARDAAARLREPFLMTGAEPDGVLGSCLRTLGIPLIDQRRFTVDDIAVQVVLPDARIEFGRAALTAAELTAWGLAKPESARALVRALEGAAQAERQAMLEGASTRRRRRHGSDASGPSPTAPVFARGWPQEAVDAPDAVRTVLAAICRGLSHLGETPASPEARARLVGGLLSGAAVLGGGAGFDELIRRRAKAVFAEFRTPDRPFELVTVAGQPAVALADSGEIWACRVLVLNAPLAGLARVLGDETPPALRASAPILRRVVRHFRGPRAVFPQGMADRVICLPDPDAGAEPPVVTLLRTPSEGEQFDLLASAIAPAGAPTDEMESWIERVVRRLLPFSEQRLQVQSLPEPVWDTDALQSHPGDGGWPRVVSSRLSARPSIHLLDRARLGDLGFEGDLLLGLHAADAIGGELP